MKLKDMLDLHRIYVLIHSAAEEGSDDQNRYLEEIQKLEDEIIAKYGGENK